MALRIGEVIDIEIKRMGINGEGIGYFNKLAVFVKGAIPGETIKARITDVSPNMAEAIIASKTNNSKNRINPLCPYYDECGGCQTEHVKYDKMKEFKREMIKESISRYTSLNPYSFETKPTIGMENPWYYRNKSSLLIKKFDDTTKVCMITEGSNQFFQIDDCLVQDKRINKVNREICKIVDELEITTFNSKFGRGVLKYLVCRVAASTGNIQVCFVCNEKSEKIRELASKVIQLENVKSVYENFNDGKDLSILGSKTNFLAGDEFITETIGDYKYNLLPTTFFQLNPIQTKVMYDEIKKAAKLSFKEVVLDAYCGVGAIGIYLSKLAKEVIGIESNKDSVIQANNNVILNKIKNANFHQGDVTELLPKMISEGTVFDVIVVDPPRTGLGEELVKTILQVKTKRFIYVSCNPSTFAKDLALLSEVYSVKYIQPIDMFPQTSLVELVCLLELKKV